MQRKSEANCRAKQVSAAHHSKNCMRSTTVKIIIGRAHMPIFCHSCKAISTVIHFQSIHGTTLAYLIYLLLSV